MAPILSSKPHRRYIAATLVWLAFGLTSQVAEASCGDWLSNGHGESWLHSSAGQADAGTADPDSDLVPYSPAPESPCQGPSCDSRQPVRLPSAPQPKPTAERDEGLVTRHAGPVVQAGPHAYPGDVQIAARQGFPLAIEHPPRF